MSLHSVIQTELTNSSLTTQTTAGIDRSKSS